MPDSNILPQWVLLCRPGFFRGRFIFALLSDFNKIAKITHAKYILLAALPRRAAGLRSDCQRFYILAALPRRALTQ